MRLGADQRGMRAEGCLAYANPRMAMANLLETLLSRTSRKILSALAGKSTLSQWGQEPTLISVTFVLFIAASLAPIFNRADGKERLGPFTPTAELINGRAAM